MITKNKETQISKDVQNKKLRIVRAFDAPVADVWRAWTESDLLNSWWAPKPWKAKTKTMNFREGGFWLYCMEGPDGTQHWAHRFRDLNLYLILQFTTSSKLIYIIQCGVGNLRECFFCKKSLVGSYDYVGESHESHQYIVIDHDVGEVFKKTDVLPARIHRGPGSQDDSFLASRLRRWCR